MLKRSYTCTHAYLWREREKEWELETAARSHEAPIDEAFERRQHPSNRCGAAKVMMQLANVAQETGGRPTQFDMFQRGLFQPIPAETEKLVRRWLRGVIERNDSRGVCE